jgi:hypothetical protein
MDMSEIFPMIKRGFDRKNEGSVMRPVGHLTPWCNFHNGSDVRTKRVNGSDGISTVSEAGARAADATYDGAGLHAAKIPLLLESHMGTRHDSGYDGKIEGTWW